MFNKLRDKFLILNLVIISIMMLIAFATIYLITYDNVYSEINKELRKLSEISIRPNEALHDGRRSPAPPSKGDDSFHPLEKRLVSFTVIIDEAWDTIDFHSVFDIEDTFYDAAKEAALNQYKSSGHFKLAGNTWAFLIKKHPSGYKIVFLDITFQQNIMLRLIYTFLAVACVMLIFIFFISRFFANKAIAPIKEAFDKQKQFIADASHELKTPLAVINTNTDVLLSHKDEPIGIHSKWLYYIRSEAERMTKLTNDLLYLTQVDYSDIKVIFNNFNLSEVLENVLLTMEAVIYEHDISLEYAITPDITVFGNVEQITQVMIILIDNAIKYTPLKGSITIELKRQHNNALLSVTNTGVGIPAEDLTKIFDRFYRIDKSRSRAKGSYGLGLAIAAAIMNQHNGKITASSILNESTSFTVELPCIMH